MADEKSKGGNTGLPFGLCAKYGIRLPDGATPKDAWEALHNVFGLTPEQICDTLSKTGELPIPKAEEKVTKLSKKEWAQWYKAIGDIKRGMYVHRKNGKKYIIIGNKIVITSGTYESPKAEKVIEFDSWEKIEEFLK